MERARKADNRSGISTIKNGEIDEDNVGKSKDKKQGIISKLFNGSNEIKKMRQQWELDLINIQNNLDDVTFQLEKLEKLCFEYKNLLELSSNEECNFNEITVAVTDCKEATNVASDKVKVLIGKTNGYKIENEKGYKTASKQRKALIKSKFDEIIQQTNLLSTYRLNNNVTNIDGDDNSDDKENKEIEVKINQKKISNNKKRRESTSNESESVVDQISELNNKRKSTNKKNNSRNDVSESENKASNSESDVGESENKSSDSESDVN